MKQNIFELVKKIKKLGIENGRIFLIMHDTNKVELKYELRNHGHTYHKHETEITDLFNCNSLMTITNRICALITKEETMDSFYLPRLDKEDYFIHQASIVSAFK